MSSRHAPTDRLDLALALALFVGTLALLMSTTQMGFTRDESFYFHAAREYIGWFRALGDAWADGETARAFSQEVVDAHWSYNREHPALMKTLFALSHELFHVELGWLGVADAMRLPAMVTSAALSSLVYLFGRQLFGRAAGALGVAALLLQPHVFFHMHMACFDAPMVTMWFAVVYAYWRGLDSRPWSVATGALWGLALATKLNAFFLPPLLVVHWALARGRGTTLSREGAWSVRLPEVPWFLVWMAILGPLVFFLHWPRIWFDTFERVRWYIAFHLQHVHYFVYYFGENLQHPPFPRALPFTLTLVTVPATILTASAIGAWAYVRERARWTARWRVDEEGEGQEASAQDAATTRPRATGWLILVNILFPIMLISAPETPVFGGTKHWMPAMPFLAMLAGFGVVWAGRRVVAGWASAPARVALHATLAAALIAPAGVELANNHPFGISYYNELIGSHRGAAEARAMRQFWGYTSRQAIPWLERDAPRNSRVWTHNTTGWAWNDYLKDGVRTREDLRSSSLARSDYALFHHQKAFHHKLAELYRSYGRVAPVHVVDVDGVPVLTVYRRPERPKKAPRVKPVKPPVESP